MPGVSKAQKAEAKYNVVFDYPNFGLHSAAVTGNLGLAKYALDHGQPVNSALDGVLPLHAAAFGGSDLVVRMLIEYGADVNAPKLPRRYSTDKHRGVTTPPVVVTGPSGSTSLHFACMHGHLTVVLTLLMHGAHPDRTDKHGSTPEMIARRNGFNDCADVLQQWAHNKDKDLRERDTRQVLVEDHSSKEDKPHAYCGRLDCLECASRKRIRMKRSIDNAFHMLRHTSSTHSATLTPPHSAGSISASTSIQPPSPVDRPFGQYTFYPTSDNASEDLPPRRPSLPQVLEIPRTVATAHRSRRPSNLSGTSSHRPRSAGSDIDQSSNQRVKGKISLLQIFKRGPEGTPDSNSASSSGVTSTSVSPSAPSALALSAIHSRSSDALATSAGEPSVSSHPAVNQLHQRVLAESATSTLLSSEASGDDSRNGSALFLPESASKPSPSGRPGILRAAHGRSSSSGQSGTPDGNRAGSGPPSARALRFESNSSGAATATRRSNSRVRTTRADSRSPSRPVRGRGSFSSLRSRSPSSPWGMRFESEPEQLFSSAAALDAYERGYIEEEHEEDECGHPVQPQDGMDELDMRLKDLKVHASRRMSVESRASDLDSQDTISHRFDCPFSINIPPPEEEAPELEADGKAMMDSRMRGNSLSSMVTDSSSGAQSSSVPTPSLTQSSLPGPLVFSPSMEQGDLPSPGEVSSDRKDPGSLSVSPGKHARGPLDIDIRTISSHAQAEALVQRTQQLIISMEDEPAEECKSLGLNIGEGHTPLSAKLAALGASLEIERKFKEEEQKQRQGDSPLASPNSIVQQKFSLQMRTHSDPSPMTSSVQRPSTSDGQTHPNHADFFLSPGPSRPDMLSASDPMGHKLRHWASSTASLNGTRSDMLSMFPPRSRTPDPDIDRRFATLASGMPLTRYPTCPAEESIMPRHELLTKQERQAARAQKLAKMGFSSTGAADSWKESTSFSRNQQQQQHRHHRFGGIKTLVQSLTGRA